MDFARTVSTKKGDVAGGEEEEEQAEQQPQPQQQPEEQPEEAVVAEEAEEEAVAPRVSLTLPTKDRREDIFNEVDLAAGGALTLAQVDRAVSRLWPALNHKAPIMRAYKAADMAGTGVCKYLRAFQIIIAYMLNHD